MTIRTVFGSLVLCGSLAACTAEKTSDESLYLTGTEEAAVTAANGAKTCTGHKVLVCHIPPGNPENAHTICVAEAAVEAHQSHHADTLGACATEPSPPPTEPPPTDDDGGEDDGGGDDGSGGGGGGGSGGEPPPVLE